MIDNLRQRADRMVMTDSMLALYDHLVNAHQAA